MHLSTYENVTDVHMNMNTKNAITTGEEGSGIHVRSFEFFSM
jgi:hypothetical protein